MASQVRPEFQVLQQQLTSYIRDPEHSPYGPLGEPIEPRRLQAYQELFYNNTYDFFSNLFVVLKEIVGDARFGELVREYMQVHRARTPLFHEMGQEFVAFLQDEYQPQAGDLQKEKLIALAQYEWLELAVAIQPVETEPNPDGLQWDWSKRYRVSPSVWQVYYPWPVQQMTAENAAQLEARDTYLLLYRDVEDEVQFIELSAMLYALVQVFVTQEGNTAETVLNFFAAQTRQDVAKLQHFSEPLLSDLLAVNVLLQHG